MHATAAIELARCERPGTRRRAVRGARPPRTRGVASRRAVRRSAQPSAGRLVARAALRSDRAPRGGVGHQLRPANPRRDVPGPRLRTRRGRAGDRRLDPWRSGGRRGATRARPRCLPVRRRVRLAAMRLPPAARQCGAGDHGGGRRRDHLREVRAGDADGVRARRRRSTRCWSQACCGPPGSTVSGCRTAAARHGSGRSFEPADWSSSVDRERRLADGQPSPRLSHPYALADARARARARP